VTPEDLPADAPTQLGAIHRMLRDRRKALGLNLHDAAEQIGISFNSLSRVERGLAPDAPALIAILAWLGFAVGWLDDDPDVDAAGIGEQWAYHRGWQDCANAHRAGVDSLAAAGPPARIAPGVEQWLTTEPACSECGGRPKRGLIRSETDDSWQCEGCYQALAAGPIPDGGSGR
jgi:transcriptional regulator with XRE-family HTH domain